jgi:hypothetical protein
MPLSHATALTALIMLVILCAGYAAADATPEAASPAAAAPAASAAP